jgi:hypothetical protein
MENRPFIKLNLRPWRLSKTADNEFIADVIYTGKTMDNREVAAEVSKRLGVVSEDVALSVLNSRDEVALGAITHGRPVQDGIGRLVIKVTGPWIGDVREFDRNIHKVTVGFTLTDRAREEVDKVGIVVNGDAPVPAFIGRVTDVETGRTDGFITGDGDIIVEGERICVAPLGVPGFGPRFVPASGAAIPVIRPLSLNTPKKLVVRVPNLADGDYTFEVVTCYSSGRTLLKTPRVITYAHKLRVGADDKAAEDNSAEE